MEKKIIFIEGLPGVGKTFLINTLEERNVDSLEKVKK